MGWCLSTNSARARASGMALPLHDLALPPGRGTADHHSRAVPAPPSLPISRSAPLLFTMFCVCSGPHRLPFWEGGARQIGLTCPLREIRSPSPRSPSPNGHGSFGIASSWQGALRAPRKAVNSPISRLARRHVRRLDSCTQRSVCVVVVVLLPSAAGFLSVPRLVSTETAGNPP